MRFEWVWFFTEHVPDVTVEHYDLTLNIVHCTMSTPHRALCHPKRAKHTATTQVSLHFVSTILYV